MSLVVILVVLFFTILSSKTMKMGLTALSKDNLVSRKECQIFDDYTDSRFEEYLAFQRRMDKPIVYLTFNPFCGLANYLQGIRGMVVLSEVLNFGLRSASFE
ncbi:hypothetical protein WA171_002352 [Blastocystis sp. BT1]